MPGRKVELKFADIWANTSNIDQYYRRHTERLETPFTGIVIGTSVPHTKTKQSQTYRRAAPLYEPTNSHSICVRSNNVSFRLRTKKNFVLNDLHPNAMVCNINWFIIQSRTWVIVFGMGTVNFRTFCPRYTKLCNDTRDCIEWVRRGKGGKVIHQLVWITPKRKHCQTRTI